MLNNCFGSVYPTGPRERPKRASESRAKTRLHRERKLAKKILSHGEFLLAEQCIRALESSKRVFCVYWRTVLGLRTLQVQERGPKGPQKVGQQLAYIDSAH
jgi:hypothetical protein